MSEKETQLQIEFLQVRESSGNGSWHSVRTLQKGITELYAILSGVMGQVGLWQNRSLATGHGRGLQLVSGGRRIMTTSSIY